jgi:hypothetical protein
MVTWIIRQQISPPLHVYKLRSRTSQSRTRHFTIHLIAHFVSCSQLLTLALHFQERLSNPYDIFKEAISQLDMEEREFRLRKLTLSWDYRQRKTDTVLRGHVSDLSSSSKIDLLHTEWENCHWKPLPIPTDPWDEKLGAYMQGARDHTCKTHRIILGTRGWNLSSKDVFGPHLRVRRTTLKK